MYSTMGQWIFWQGLKYFLFFLLLRFSKLQRQIERRKSEHQWLQHGYQTISQRMLCDCSLKRLCISYSSKVSSFLPFLGTLSMYFQIIINTTHAVTIVNDALSKRWFLLLCSGVGVMLLESHGKRLTYLSDIQGWTKVGTYSYLYLHTAV